MPNHKPYPSDWHGTTLGTLASYVNGRAFKPEDWGTVGLPIIRIQQMNDPYSPIDYFSGPVSSTFRIDDGDLLFSWSAKLSTAIWDRGAAVLNQHIFKVIPNKGTDLHFLHHLLNYSIERLSEQTHGSTMKHIKRTDLLPFPVHVPELPEQCQIANILDTTDAAIQETEGLIAKLKQMRVGLLQDLLTRGLDKHGKLRDPIAHPEQFRDHPLGKIADEWDIKPLEHWVRPDAPITYGIVQAGPHIDDGVPYIRTGDMAGERLSLSGLLRTSERIAALYRRSEVRTGEIVCAIRATVGKVLEVPPELDGANLTQGTARIAPSEAVAGRFLLWSLRSQPVQRQFELAVKGTTFQEITLRELRRIQVAIPSDRTEQDRIAEILDAHDASICSEEAYRDKLKLLKQGLMDDLLTGRVRVPVAEEAAV